MTITATWSDLEPGTVVDREVHKDTITSLEDVRELVNALARPHTSEAYLIHARRSKTFEEITKRYVADHQVFIGVWGEFGYIEFFDPIHWSQPIGDPASPEWHTTTSGHFLAGSGIPVETLIKALTEFLTTAERPTCVQWQEIGSTSK